MRWIAFIIKESPTFLALVVLRAGHHHLVVEEVGALEESPELPKRGLRVGEHLGDHAGLAPDHLFVERAHFVGVAGVAEHAGALRGDSDLADGLLHRGCH